MDQYILTDAKAGIVAHDIKNPEKAAALVFSCGKNSYAIGKSRFRHLIILRENQKNIFIFRVGNYYLGVVKQKNISNEALADNIIKFLKGLF